MPDPATISHGAALLFGVMAGALACALVYESRRAKDATRRFRARLSDIMARYRTEDGGRLGVVLPLPPQVQEPEWARRREAEAESSAEHDDDPYPYDDDAEYPRNEARVTQGPWVRRSTNASMVMDRNVQAPVWQFNARQQGGRHRDVSNDDTQRISQARVMAALRRGEAS